MIHQDWIGCVMKYVINKIIDQSKIMDNKMVGGLIRGMVWSVTGTILSKTLIMVASIVTARMLEVDKNGEYGVIHSTILMFSTFAGLGLGTTATRFVAEYKDADKEKCGRIIGLTNLFALLSGCMMLSILITLSSWLAQNQLHAPHLQSGLVFASVMLITNTVNTVQVSTLAGFQEFRRIAQLNIIQGIMALPIYIAGTSLLGVNGLILGQVAVSVIMVLLSGLENKKVRKRHDIKLDIVKAGRELSILWTFSIPSMLSNVMAFFSWATRRSHRLAARLSCADDCTTSKR
jgi:O-antigen/teichoic acid export membrane protein